MNVEVFRHFPSLTTSHLTLRQLQATDEEALFAMKSRPEVTTPYGQEPHQSLADTRAWIQRIHAFYERHEAIFWCVTFKDEESVIGTCTLWNIDPDFLCGEIGYELNPKYGRQGIMTEAVSGVLKYAFTEFGLHRVEAVIMAENTPSRRLLEKLGFTCEGNLRQRQRFRGRFIDQLYFGLLKTEWPESASFT